MMQVLVLLVPVAAETNFRGSAAARDQGEVSAPEVPQARSTSTSKEEVAANLPQQQEVAGSDHSSPDLHDANPKVLTMLIRDLINAFKMDVAVSEQRSPHELDASPKVLSLLVRELINAFKMDASVNEQRSLHELDASPKVITMLYRDLINAFKMDVAVSERRSPDELDASPKVLTLLVRKLINAFKMDVAVSDHSSSDQHDARSKIIGLLIGGIMHELHKDGHDESNKVTSAFSFEPVIAPQSESSGPAVPGESDLNNVHSPVFV